MSIVNRIRSSTHKEIGTGVFRYWYQVVVDRDAVTCWVMEFYGCLSFFSMTLPKDTTRTLGAGPAV